MTFVASVRTHAVPFLNGRMVRLIVASMGSDKPQNQVHRVRRAFDSDRCLFLYAIAVSAVVHVLLQVLLSF